MKQIQKFKTLITQELYFEAHEALEEIWFPIRKIKDEYSFLLKGFINGAVCLELFKRNKIKQSEKIYLVYKKYVTKERITKIQTDINFLELKVFMDNHIKQIMIEKNHETTNFKI